MVDINFGLLVISGIVLLAVLKVAKTGVASPDTSTGKVINATDRYPIEVPKAGPVDWQREPPDTRLPDKEYTVSETTESQEPTPDTTDSDDPESAELEFAWEFEGDITFDDVGGMVDLKQELRMDTIYPLKSDTDLFESMGITAPNVLFHGPPGTGKTYMARALAGELDVPFVELSGSTLQSRWINESATKVATLFSEAQSVAENHGGALIFVDELDSVLRARTTNGNAHAEDAKVVTEFLSQLQTTDDHDIVFVGATNRAEILDEAGIRPGRIDKHVEIPMPDRNARKAILQAQLDTRPHDVTESNIAHAARRLEGQSAADISSIVEAAARRAVYARGGDTILWDDVQLAVEDHMASRDP